MNHTSRYDHPVFIIKCFLPERSIIPLIFAKFINSFCNGVCILFHQIADTNHCIAARAFWNSHKFHFTINADITFVVYKIADHIP